MTDRELLELAAKAVGFGKDTGVIWTKSEWPRNCGIEGALWDWTGHGSTANLWNPLNDDGDALRLAVKLEMDVVNYGGSVECYFWLDKENDEYVSEKISDCRLAATRRAIVRAAAAIGSKL